MNIRSTFILVVVLALVAGYLLFYEVRKPAEQAPEPPWFYTTSMDAMERIQVTADGKTAAFVRQEKGWYFEEPPGLPVDQARWGGVTLLLSGPKSHRLLREKMDDPTKYGLDKPTAIFDVDLTGKRHVQVRLGLWTPDNLSNYAQQRGDEGVFLVDASWGQVLRRLALEPPHPLWYYKLDPNRVIFLSVSYKNATASFTRDSDGWRFADQERTPVDQQRWSQILPLLGGPPSLRILQDSLKDPTQFGLKEPTATIQVEYEPPRGLSEEIRRGFRLLIGHRLPDGSGYYAQPQGEEFLLSVDTSWLDTILGLASDPPRAAAKAS